MNQSHRGNRTHIVIAGRCNTGKSTLLNRLVGQQASLVSAQPGTTADPVKVAFELLPHGPVLLYDTAGLDEPQTLGSLRREASHKAIAGADALVLVIDQRGIEQLELELINQAKALGTPLLVVAAKADTAPVPAEAAAQCTQLGLACLAANLNSPASTAPLREALLALLPEQRAEPTLLVDLVPPGGLVVCVVPIDASAPKGRLIAPQVQLLRELTEHGRLALLCQPDTLPGALAALATPPSMVVADSQAVLQTAAIVPQTVPLTTFSLLFARLKGNFALQLAGAQAIHGLRDGDRVLVAEACAHHAQEDDIARVKIPALLRRHCACELRIDHVSGQDFPEDLDQYALVLHCGACMLTAGQMRRRLRQCAAAGVAVSNYGMAISLCQGVLERAAAPLLRGTLPDLTA